MSLLFVVSSADRVACGSGASLDNLNPLTVMTWVYPTSFVANRRIFNKGTGVHSQNGFNVVDTLGNLEYVRGRATTDLDFVTTGGPLTANNWYCVAATLDSAASPVCHIYTGSLTAAMVEASMAATTAGAGTVFDDSANNFVIGNSHLHL